MYQLVCAMCNVLRSGIDSKFREHVEIKDVEVLRPKNIPILVPATNYI